MGVFHDPDKLRPWLVGVLCTLWALVQLSLYLKFGFQDGGDSPRYYGAAEAILNGDLPSGKARSYLGYDLFVAALTSLGFGRSGIGLAQVLLSGVATLALFRTGESLYEQRVGFAAALLYVLFPDIHYWNFVIYTESFYSTMLVVSVYLLVTAGSARQYLIALLAVLFTSSIRPHGVGFALAVSCYLLFRLYAAGNRRVLGVVFLVLLLVFPLMWSAAGHMIKFETVIRHYVDGTVIWGYEGATLAMPGEVTGAVDDFSHPVVQILVFALDMPSYFFTLVASKLYFFFMHVRPYFAHYHNLISLLVLVPAYLFAVWGIIRVPTRRRVDKSLLLGVVLFQALIVSLTFADWDGRHLIPILSMMFLVSASGFWATWDRFMAGRAAAPGGQAAAGDRDQVEGRERPALESQKDSAEDPS